MERIFGMPVARVYPLYVQKVSVRAAQRTTSMPSRDG
jgi:hypothetical protein